MNTSIQRSLLHLVLLLLLCLCCSCQAAKSASSSVAPPKATTDSERLGDSLMETGRIQQAVDEYDRALAAGADKASIAYRKGFAYFNEGKWKKALDLFQEAIGMDPKMTIAYEGAAIASFQLGHLDQASDYFIDVMQKAPKHWVPYAFMAGIFGAQKNMRGAREMHKKALETAGKNQARQVNALLSETYKRGEQLIRTGMYKPGRTIPDSPKAAPSHQEAAASEKTSVYRSVQTLSPEEKEKIRKQFLASVNKNQTESDTASSEHPPATEAPALEPPKKNIVQITPLDDTEVQALLRAHKTGQIKEKRVQAAAEDAPAVEEPSETTRVTAVVPSEPLPATAEQPRNEPTKTSGPDSFITGAQQLVTAPPVESYTAASSDADDAFLRDLPKSGYSAMESSFPNSRMAEERARALKDKGLNPYVAPADLGDRGTWYRVLFGPFDTYKEAQKMRNTLAKQYGLNKTIILKHTNK